MPQGKLNASYVGSVAWNVLTDDQTVNVSGVTSRGIFISTDSGWTLFVSSEDSRGPLTINIMDQFKPIKALKIGMIARASREGLCFSDIRIRISFENTSIYSAQLPPGEIQTPEQLTTNVFLILNFLSSNDKALHISPMLSTFIDLVEEPTNYRKIISRRSTVITNPFTHPILILFQSLKLKDLDASCNALTTLLGLGQGLTPSGDDLVIGFLLALNRYSLLCPWLIRSEFNQRIIDAGYRRTTRLSGNLIDCAASGQADERLITALDGIISSKLDTKASLSQLANWGNSSGLDAWVGMALAILYS